MLARVGEARREAGQKGPRNVNELTLTDPVAQRVGRFFADLMATLAENGDTGAAAVESVGALWLPERSGRGLTSVETDPQALVQGIGAVAMLLADELVTARTAAGAPEATAADVWREVVMALGAEPGDDEASDDSRIDLP